MGFLNFAKQKKGMPVEFSGFCEVHLPEQESKEFWVHPSWETIYQQ